MLYCLRSTVNQTQVLQTQSKTQAYTETLVSPAVRSSRPCICLSSFPLDTRWLNHGCFQIISIKLC